MCPYGTECEVRFVEDDEEDLQREVQDGRCRRRREGRQDPLPGRLGDRVGNVGVSVQPSDGRES